MLFNEKGETTFFDESTVRFKFSGIQKRFWYTPGSRLIFVYKDDTSKYAERALPLQHDDDPTVDSAKKRAHSWLKFLEKEGTNLAKREQTKREIKSITHEPTGPQCCICLNPDNGDLVDHNNRQFCMSCYITANR